MPMLLPYKVQAPTEIVDIASWAPDPETPIHPVGARDKRVVIAPTPSAHPFLVAGHRYLFKLSIERHPVQFWSEVLAYRLGCLVGVEVPPAFVAIDSSNGEIGSLIEYFYGLPGHPDEQYVAGGDYMQRLIPGFDRARGSQHNVRDLRVVGRMLKAHGVVLPDAHWARIFTFDALIGNTDRHQDNWGVLWHRTAEGPRLARFAPAFDNGTSLGYNILEDRLAARREARALEAFIGKGRHHIRWHRRDEEPCQHWVLLDKLMALYAETRAAVARTVSFDIDEAKAVLLELEQFAIQPAFSRHRTDFVLDTLRARQTIIAQLVKAHGP